MSGDLQAVIQQYSAYGPLLASFLANLLATFGDKGQLVVITLASRYDAKRVFVGAMAAFGLWSAVEVLLGQWIVTVLPGDLMTLLTGGLFLVFGVWTLHTAVQSFRLARAESIDGALVTGGGLDVGLSGMLLPDVALRRLGAYGGVFTSFVFIMFAEFGDKTQLLTINLAATFPDAPVWVFIGVVAALGLRTGVDAVIGERIEKWVPTRWIELAAAVVFLTFGLTVLGYLSSSALLAVLAAIVLLGVLGGVRKLVSRRR